MKLKFTEFPGSRGRTSAYRKLLTCLVFSVLVLGSSSKVFSSNLPLTSRSLESAASLSSDGKTTVRILLGPLKRGTVYQAAEDGINSSLSVGGIPNGIVFDPSNGNLYVANFGPGTVSVINGSSNSVIETIDLNYPVSPWDVSYDPNNGHIYVSDTKNGAVSVVNTTDDTVLATVAVGDDMLSGDHDDRPNGLAFDPYNGYMYVAMYGSGYLAEVDPEKNILVGNAPIGQDAFVNSGLWGLAFDPADCNFYASNEVENTLTVVNAVSNSLVSTISTGRSPNGVAVDINQGSSYGDVLVANYAANTVSVFNASSNTMIQTINVGQNPDGIAFDPNSGDFYVANYGSGTVSVIDGATFQVVSTLPAGSGASGVAYDPENGNVYITDANSATVYVITTGDILSSANKTLSQQYSGSNCSDQTTVQSSALAASSSSSVSSDIVTSTTTSTSSLTSISTAVTSATSSGSTMTVVSTTSYSTSDQAASSTNDGTGISVYLVSAIALMSGIIVASVLVLKKRVSRE